MNWRIVWLLSILGSLTLQLVFAGPVSDVVNHTQMASVVSQGIDEIRNQVSREFFSESSLTQPGRKIPLKDAVFIHNAQNRVFGEQHRDEVSLLLDLSKNLLLVVQGNQVIYTALAATGSGKELRDPTNPSRTWKFETPRGTFTIETKLENPVWIRPDWAFIEKGLPVPEKQSQRLLRNVLGEYALGFGNGYFIHGALYTYLLGFNVTHGCIQLNEKDLRYIYETVPVGAQLVIL